MALIIFLVISLLVHGSLGEIICDELPAEMCSFSVASSGKRCLLETTLATNDDGNVKLQCKTSEVVVENMAEWIESDECVSSCGLDRKTFGISSDSLMESQFTAKLCAPACYQNCPNIVDLYSNLALGEGVFLPDLCKVQRTMPRRATTQLLSSGAAPGSTSAAAAGPISPAEGPSSSSVADADAAASI